MDFEVVGEISEEETFAVGEAIRELPRLRGEFGAGRWRKRNGIASVRLRNGSIKARNTFANESVGQAARRR